MLSLKNKYSNGIMDGEIDEISSSIYELVLLLKRFLTEIIICNIVQINSTIGIIIFYASNYK